MDTNILFLHKSFIKGGGVERVHQNLAVALTEKGVTYSFFVLNGHGQSQDGFSILNESHRAIRAPVSSGSNAKLNALFKVIKTQDITAIIAATETANLMALFCKVRFPSINVVYTRHCAFDVSDQKLAPWAIRAFYSLYLTNGNVVAVSKALKEQIAASTIWGKSKIHFVPNAVISEKMFELSNSGLPLPIQGDYFIAVGRLVEQKGFDLLLHAYALSSKSDSKLPKLVIAGAGEDEDSLKLLSGKLGINNSVSFIGYTSNPYNLIKYACAFILSSRHEGMPTVLVEAMALETPVIAFDCPTGPNELIVNGENGALVKHLDIEQLSNAISKYKTLPCKNLRESVDHFSYSEVASNYISLCEATT
jgi:glycosyltransferase involved in cell wall biosynthesis